MYRYNRVAKVATPSFTSTRLLDQVRERIRYLHYSQATEKAYLFWLRAFIRWSGLRHPRDMGKPEVEAFLSMLANERRVTSSTHKQALSAIMFLYREVLGQELPWLQEIGRPVQSKRVPSFLTKQEIVSVLACLEGEEQLLAKVLYGTGMRLIEGLSLRVKDVDFDRRTVVVRDGKGGKDRVVMLPRTIEAGLRAQLARSRALWDADRRAGVPGVFMPHGRSSRQAITRRIRTPRSSGATIFMRSAKAVRSKKQLRQQGLPSTFRSTRCATASPRTCFKRAPTSEPCRSSWATAM